MDVLHMPETLFSEKLTFHARHSLKEAREIARYAKSQCIEPKHLLLALLLEHGSLGSFLLKNIGFEKDVLAKLCLTSKTTGKRVVPAALPLAPPLKTILRRAYFLASRFQYPYVGTEHLASALIEAEKSHLRDIFIASGIDETKAETTIKAHLHFEQFPQLAKMFDLPDGFFARPSTAVKSQTPFLDQYTVDIGSENKRRDECFVGRNEELSRMMQILSRKQKNNPLLIGEPGVGKTALVSSLAHRIDTGDVPAHLLDKRLLSLDLALVVAGTNFRGEFESRLKEIVKEATAHPEIILFIDELHTIVGAGNTSGGLDAANILKPALARGDIRCIGATTLSEYKRHIEKDSALERRFQPLLIEEPDIDDARRILLGVKESYERFHNVQIPDTMIDRALSLGIRHLPDRFLPDKAIDILDEAAALARERSDTSPLSRELLKLKTRQRQLLREKASLVHAEQYEKAARWHTEEKMLSQKIASLQNKQSQISRKKPSLLTENDILRTVSRMTNIPLDKLSSERPLQTLRRLERSLCTRLVGQTAAAAALTETLSRSLSHLSDPERPLGSFLFLGPTGVGKTFAAKILAEEFFGDRNALVRLDMSEFMERHSVAQILGAPAGYVGYGEGGKLTEKIRRRPYSVVLFDEIEKAHPDVHNILLQILDEGILTDAEGRRISFRHALILLTSNIGTASFTQTARIGFGKRLDRSRPQEHFEHLKRQVLEDLKKEIRPELLARLDHTLVFDALSPGDIRAIVTTEMKRLATRLQERGITLRYAPNVLAHLARKSFSPEQGARLVRKNIQMLVEKPLGDRLLSKSATTLTLSLENDSILCR